MNIESIEGKIEYKYHGLKLEGEEYLLLQLQNLQLMQINENKVLVLILFQATLNHCKILVCQLLLQIMISSFLLSLPRFWVLTFQTFAPIFAK